MKYLACSILIIIFPLFTKAQIEEQQNNLIKKLSVELMIILDNNNQLDSFFYDKNGYLWKQITYKDGKLTQYNEALKFDNHNRVLEEVSISLKFNYNELETTLSKYKYEYLDTILLTEEQISLDSFGNQKYNYKVKYTYDEAGRVNLKVETYDISNDTTVYKYEYDSNDRVAKEYITTAKTLPRYNMIVEHKYDENGKLVEDKNAYSSSSYNRSVYLYNKKNLIYKITTYTLGISSFQDITKEENKENITLENKYLYYDNGLISESISENIKFRDINKFQYKYYKKN